RPRQGAAFAEPRTGVKKEAFGLAGPARRSARLLPGAAQRWRQRRRSGIAARREASPLGGRCEASPLGGRRKKKRKKLRARNKMTFQKPLTPALSPQAGRGRISF